MAKTMRNFDRGCQNRGPFSPSSRLRCEYPRKATSLFLKKRAKKITPMNRKEGLASLIIIHPWRLCPIEFLKESTELSDDGLHIHRGISFVDHSVDSFHQIHQFLVLQASLQSTDDFQGGPIGRGKSEDLFEEVPQNRIDLKIEPFSMIVVVETIF